MKKDVSSVLVDSNVFDFLNEIKKQLSNNWVYLKFDVLKITEKFDCFEKYQNVQRLNGDGSITELILVTFKNKEYERIVFDMQSCRLGGRTTYYLVHSIRIKDEVTNAPTNPDDVIFYI